MADIGRAENRCVREGSAEMATAGVNRMMLWTDLEGRELLGRWLLGPLVRPEGRTAWFAATAEGRPLMLSITETLNDDEELLARLKAAAEVRHPNVATVEEACAAYVDETPVVIAAIEPTDENLGDVLRERTLRAAEAQQVLSALVQGLAAIHARGLVHGRMEPASVLAMGDTIKLRSDCLQIGGADFAARSGEDVRGLGRIVTQAMTGRIPAGENDALLQLLPEPMGRTVRRALSGNARITEIVALAGVVIVPAARAPEPTHAVRPGPVAVPVESDAPPPQATSSAADPVVLPAAAAAEPPQPAESSTTQPAKSAAKVIALLAARAPAEPRQPGEPSAPAIAAQDDHANATDGGPSPGTPRRSAPLVIAVAALLLVATLWAVYGVMHSGKAANPAKPATPTAGSTVPMPQKPAVAGRAAPAVQGGGSATVALMTPGWRVIAYTYMHEAQAQHKAQVIRQRFPQLTPGVFALHGTAPYLVTLGGVMSRADALALRDKAVQMGLPRDTYAQNYR
jgi:eukaryotic-like serine/threonine-protein kinase